MEVAISSEDLSVQRCLFYLFVRCLESEQVQKHPETPKLQHRRMRRELWLLEVTATIAEVSYSGYQKLQGGASRVWGVHSGVK